MGTINGTIRTCKIENVSLVNPALKVAYITADFAAYSSSDSATVTGILTEIGNRVRNGKTLTLRHAMMGPPGRDTNNQLVYVDNSITLNNTTTTGDLAFDLATIAGAELTSSTATDVAVGMYVVYSEA